jgi:hypothetical protein
MREPDFELDGWCLDDGEARHREAPETFWIPALEDRERLGPGDLVKLIFRIAIDKEVEPVAVERMWVLVRERVGGAYLGLLDNDPSALAENDELWSGVEIPFEPRHVIDIDPADEATEAKAKEPPTRRWR